MDTIVISDLHLSDSEPVNPKFPLWKKFKNKEFFIDKDLAAFIQKISDDTSTSGCELVLNGDIFDFDSVMSLPIENYNYPISRYEKLTGLNPLEDKSVFKIKTILDEHYIFVNALKGFLNKNKNNKIVFIVGNHDLELNWIKVQEEISLQVSDKKNDEQIVFCEWFYISNEDTLIEHGHQYDPYCQAINPINPVIKKNGQYKMRLPFGNLANRFLINKMGLKNPHNDQSYKKSFIDFVKFFIEYEIKYQPLLVMHWFFGSIKTMFYTIGESFLPSLKDPTTMRTKIEGIAKKANATVSQVFLLQQNHSHPAGRRPWTVVKELWLDRAFLSFSIIFFSWQFFTTSSIFTNVSSNWFWIPLILLQPFFFYYAHSVTSDIQSNQDLAVEKSPVSARNCNVDRVILGHTHVAYHKYLEEIEYLNTGTWSIFFDDLECTKKVYRFTFVWIKHSENKRIAHLYQWDHGDYELTSKSKEFFENPL